MQERMANLYAPSRDTRLSGATEGEGCHHPAGPYVQTAGRPHSRLQGGTHGLTRTLGCITEPHTAGFPFLLPPA